MSGGHGGIAQFFCRDPNLLQRARSPFLPVPSSPCHPSALTPFTLLLQWPSYESLNYTSIFLAIVLLFGLWLYTLLRVTFSLKSKGYQSPTCVWHYFKRHYSLGSYRENVVLQSWKLATESGHSMDLLLSCNRNLHFLTAGVFPPDLG